MSVPVNSFAAGTYTWLRISLAYQNYNIYMNSSGQTIDATLASFIGFNTYLSSYKVKDSTVNDIKIHVKISESKKYRYFKNQQWQVGNDRLIDSHTIFNKNGVKVYFKTP